MDALTRGILKSVGMIAPLTACLTLRLLNVHGAEVTRELSLSTLLGSGRFHITGAYGG
jgi:hypothetical protein